MTNILLSGYSGNMGQVIVRLVSGMKDANISAGFDINEKPQVFPVFTDINDCSVKTDVIIDFSHPLNLNNLLDYAKSKGVPLVLATTGFSSNQIKDIQNAAKTIPIFFSFNMSLGVNLLIDLIKKATEILEDDFDVEIIEKHHNQKIDAPSGTAIMLADAVSEVSSKSREYIYDRHSSRKKRGKNEIGIHSLRGGTIVGEHSVIFSGIDEIIELKHTAMSKEVFAVGAIKAAKFMKNKPPRLYSMKDLI